MSRPPKKISYTRVEIAAAAGVGYDCVREADELGQFTTPFKMAAWVWMHRFRRISHLDVVKGQRRKSIKVTGLAVKKEGEIDDE